jgi:acid stress-induced BolA-like protein IbaG/YrbA
MKPAEIQALIEAGLPGAQVHVASDDDTHFEALIVAPQFEGKRMIQRHQLVHALSMQALTPQEHRAGH